jgi:transcription antitermination factor NusG
MPFLVAQIDMRREALAVHYLQEIVSREVYAPRVRAAHQGGRRVTLLFPGYLFVLASERGWWEVRWSPGIYRLIMSGEEPALLSDEIVADLRGREGRDGLVRLPKRTRLNGGAKFERGDTVRIAHGPMSGFTGLVEGMRGQQRVEILLALLGRVELAASAVERVER